MAQAEWGGAKGEAWQELSLKLRKFGAEIVNSAVLQFRFLFGYKVEQITEDYDLERYRKWLGGEAFNVSRNDWEKEYRKKSNATSDPAQESGT